MTDAEVRAAFQSGAPVRYLDFRGEIEYDRISAVIFRRDENGLKMTAELTDSSGRSVLIAKPEDIKLKQ